MLQKRMYRTALLSAALAAIMLAVGSLTSAAYADEDKRVGLVIRWSDGSVHTEIVSIPADGTGLDALLAASVDVATYDAGFGVAVCSVGGEGCPADDCFCDMEHFWGYWNQVDGAWVSSMVGATDHVPSDGSVDGWAWTGFDSNYNPTVKPPFYTFEEIEAMQIPAEIPEPTTFALLGSGLTGLLAYVWTRRKQA